MKLFTTSLETRIKIMIITLKNMMISKSVPTCVIATFFTTSCLIYLTSNGLDFVTYRKNPQPLLLKSLFQFMQPKNPTVYDIYKFPEYHSKWQNYTYQNLIQMTLTEKNSFFQYKENQYAKQAQWIKNLCKKFQKDAIVRKTNMCEPSPHCQRCMIVLDPKEKLAFCRNPKVGSSTWLVRFHSLLKNIPPEKEVIDMKSINEYHEDAHNWWIRDTNKKLQMLKEDKEDIHSFVFVRHPLDRLESAYYDKIVVKPGTELGPYWSNLLIEIHRKYNSTSPNTFIRFVIEENKRKQNNIFNVNEHWRPQIASCPYCLFSYKVYGKYETIVEDTAYILMKSNQENLLKIGAMNSDTKHHRASNRRKEFWSAVDSIHLDDLMKIFEMDFKMFHYQ